MSSEADGQLAARDRGGARTRAQILDVAWKLMTEHGVGVPMRDVADRVGISRQALYLHYPSRADLLTAMTRQHDVQSGIAQRFIAAAAAPSAVEALEAVIRTWFDYVPDILPVARALQAAAATDPAAAEAWWDRMTAATRPIRRVVERLHAEGVLDPSWETEAAVQFLWSLTHVRAWDDLVVHYGWSPEAFVERQTEAAKRILLTASYRTA
ncbi:MAG TPA: TetR/AcrR family transcriptional regulator [Jiangellaceae bacterium]